MLRQETDRRQERAGDEQFGQRLNHRARFEAAGIAPHHRIEHHEICESNETGGKRQAAMAKLEVKSKIVIQAKIDRDRAETDEHWQMSLVQRVESRSQNLVGRVGHEADRVTTQGQRRLFRSKSVEAAMLINQADDRVGQDDQPDGGRDRQ